jgi:hypothetical protein
MEESIEHLRADIRRLEEEITSWEREIEAIEGNPPSGIARKVTLATRPQLEQNIRAAQKVIGMKKRMIAAAADGWR